MKLLFSLSALCALLSSAAFSQAAEITFEAKADALDYAFEPGKKKYLSIEEGEKSEGLLTFRAEAGGGLATLSPKGEDLFTEAKEIEIEFRTTGRITFAVFMRGQTDESDAYMAFLGASADKTMIMYLCKTKLSGSQQPSQTALTHKHANNYLAGDWCKLRLKLGNESGKTTFSGELSEAQTGHNLIGLMADDTNNPITEPGKIVFRFFADKSGGGGSVQIKRITITP